MPKAKGIIAEHIIEFMQWNKARKNAPVLKAIKNKLNEIYSTQQLSGISASGIAPNGSIQKVINNVAGKMQVENQNGCLYINAINEFIALSA